MKVRTITAVSPLLLLLALLTLPVAAIAADPPVPAGKPNSPVVTTASPLPATPAAASAAPATEPGKKEQAILVGYVEMSRFGTETEAGKAARARLQAKSDGYRAQATAKQKQLEKQKNLLQEKMATLTPKQRETKAKEFEKKVEDYRKFAQNAEKELASLEEEVSRTLYGEVEKAAGGYGKANGLAAVIVKRDLLYVGSGVEARNVTDDIIKIMNAGTGKP
jgi:outer membrane protein